MLKDNIKRLREVLCYLSETQKRRVFKYFFYNKTLEKIADEEGVDFTSVRESVNSAIKKVEEIFLKHPPKTLSHFKQVKGLILIRI